MDRWKDDIEKLYAPVAHDGGRRDELMGKIAGIQWQAEAKAKEKTMTDSRRWFTGRWRKAAAAVVGVALFSSGFAAQQVIDAARSRVIHLGPSKPGYTLTMPDGSKQDFTTCKASDTSSDAKEVQSQVERMIARKEYRRASTYEDPGGNINHVYVFKLASGSSYSRSFLYPLEDVSDWADYQKKVQAAEVQRTKDIQDAVKNGRYRLIDLDVGKIHVCRDLATGKKLFVHMAGGKTPEACIFDDSSPGTTGTKALITPWEDHLKAIADGKRELLDIQTVKLPKYELTRADGTKFHYGYGGDPLPLNTSKPATQPAGTR